MYNFFWIRNEMVIKSNQINRIAVTGASGFIGNHLVHFLKDMGFEVRVLIHKTDIDLNVEKVIGSLNQPETHRKFLKNVDILFHLATVLGSRNLSESEFFQVNRDGTEQILKMAQKNGVKKVVHFSSAGVYGQSTGLIPFREGDHLNPVDVYERSKMAGEKIATTYAKEMDVSVIQPGWVYGEGDRRTFKLIRQINSGLFFITGSGKIKHSPVYIRDLLEATFKVALGGNKGEIYNVGGDPISVKEIVNGIGSILGKKIFPLTVPLIITYPVAFIMGKIFSFFKREAPLTTSKLAFFMRGKPLNSEKIKNDLNVEIKTHYLEGMEKTICWYKEQNWI